MNKKAKLATAALGFAGLNGAGFTVVKNGLGTGSSFDSGGAISSLFSSQSFSSSAKRLDVRGDNPDSLDLELREKVTEVNLNATEPDGLNIAPEKISSDKSKSSVLSILKEVVREEQVTGIQDDVEKSYRQTINGRDLHIKMSDLESAIKKIKEWEDKGGLKQKTKGPAKKKELPTLTQGERIALREFFDVYSYLNSTRPNWHSQLQGANDGSDFEIEDLLENTQSDMSSVQAIQNALNSIQWDRDKTKIKVEHRTSSGILVQPLPFKENSYGWGNWFRNPYKHFFQNQEEFQGAMDLIDNTQAALEAYLGSKRVAGLFATMLGTEMVKQVYKDKDKFLNALGDTQSSVELQVAKRLIKWMGR